MTRGRQGPSRTLSPGSLYRGTCLQRVPVPSVAALRPSPPSRRLTPPTIHRPASPSLISLERTKNGGLQSSPKIFCKKLCRFRTIARACRGAGDGASWRTCAPRVRSSFARKPRTQADLRLDAPRPTPIQASCGLTRSLCHCFMSIPNEACPLPGALTGWLPQSEGVLQ